MYKPYWSHLQSCHREEFGRAIAEIKSCVDDVWGLLFRTLNNVGVINNYLLSFLEFQAKSHLSPSAINQHDLVFSIFFFPLFLFSFAFFSPSLFYDQRRRPHYLQSQSCVIPITRESLAEHSIAWRGIREGPEEGSDYAQYGVVLNLLLVDREFGRCINRVINAAACQSM